MKRESDVLTCCTTAYSHPAAQWLLGDSFHPGGLALTAELANLCGIDAGSRVLDAGSGRGTSAVHLAKTTGCRVVGITLEQEGVTTGRELAQQHGVEERVVFFQTDIQEAELALESFDVVLMECVLSILPDKAATLRRLNDLLRPVGRLGLTDVTVNGVLPPELHGVLATVGCVGDALSLPEYSTLLEESDFTIQCAQDLPEVATTFLREIKGKLLMAELASKLGKLSVPVGTVEEWKRILLATQDLVRQAVLSYTLVVAQKPA